MMSRSMASVFLAVYMIMGVIPSLLAASLSNVTIDSVTTSGPTCQTLVVRYDSEDRGETGAPYTSDYYISLDSVEIATGTVTLRFGASKDEPVTISLSIPLKAGEMYTLELSGEEREDSSTGDFLSFVCVPTAESESVASSSAKAVEPPPCKLSDGRLDDTCGSAPIVVYSEALADGCYVTIYSKYGRADKQVVLLLQGTPAETAAAQAAGGAALIDQVEVVNLTSVALYWLPETGEFQINAGPNEEGKVYVLNFTGCPATNVYTTNSFQKEKAQ